MEHRLCIHRGAHAISPRFLHRAAHCRALLERCRLNAAADRAVDRRHGVGSEPGDRAQSPRYLPLVQACRQQLNGEPRGAQISVAQLIEAHGVPGAERLPRRDAFDNQVAFYDMRRGMAEQ